VVTNSAGSVLERHDYLPFGEEILSGISGRTVAQGYGASDDTRQKFTSKERDSESNLDYFIHRYYASAQGRFTTPDIPFAGQYVDNPQSWNLYLYTECNPLTAVDPDGRSTHTDSNGNVLAVYDDGDVGVYRHAGKWDGRSHLGTTGKGVAKMGETEYWYEFAKIDDKTGAVMKDKAGNVQVAQGARIDFNASWDNDLHQLAMSAMGVELKILFDESKLHQKYDIKNDSTLAPYGNYTGKLLNGKYASARSAGDYLAGMVGAVGVTEQFFNTHISETTYMKLAGAYQVLGSKLGTYQVMKILVFGTAYGPPPYYGENEYAGRRIDAGFKAGMKLALRDK
jgi:RHS repeat-associated protein